MYLVLFPDKIAAQSFFGRHRRRLEESARVRKALDND